MSLNIIDLIKGQLGPALVSQAASSLGESESGIAKAIGGLLPAVVGGLANNSSNPGVLDAITGASSSGILGNLLGGTQNNSMITSLLTSLFGDKVSGLVNTVASFAGINNNSASSLLNLVTGATVGTVGKYATDNNLGASGITSLLNDQRGILSTLLPAGLSLGALGLDFENWFDKTKETVSSVASTVRDNIAEDVERTREKVEVKREEIRNDINDNNGGGGGSILKWLLPLLLLLLAGWFLWKQCGKKADVTPVGKTDSTAIVTDTAATNTNVDAGATVQRESLTVTLPSGKTINAYKGGIEDQVVTFLKSDEYKNATEAQLKDKWFNFDNLNFEFGTTKLTPESKVQLDNLKAILAEFPAANIKIGAYTDKKGDEAANLKLSKERATAVKTALGSAQVKEADGYGSEFATVPADASDKEREADRKTAIRFVK